MRWKVKQTKWEAGDICERHPFAFFPTKIGDVVVWFERYKVTEQLKIVTMFDNGMAHPQLQWVEISRDTLDYYC